jgi:hypothetical protein
MVPSGFGRGNKWNFGRLLLNEGNAHDGDHDVGRVDL